MTESWMIWSAAGVLGLLLGSFLNVCAVRWPRDESVISPPSRCPGCGRRIRWYENVPVLGWIALRGRCRGCRERISIQYPLVELATGLIWAGMAWEHGLSWEGLRGAVFLTLLLGIAVSDARFYIIPDQFSLGGALLGIGLALAPGGITVVAALLGAVAWAAGLWAVGQLTTAWIRMRDPKRFEEMGVDWVDGALGFGDVKMMALVGAFTGLWGGAVTLFLGAVLAVVAYPVIRRVAEGLIPFGIFLAAGAGLAYVWGDAMLEWYITAMVAG